MDLVSCTVTTPNSRYKSFRHDKLHDEYVGVMFLCLIFVFELANKFNTKRKEAMNNNELVRQCGKKSLPVFHSI